MKANDIRKEWLFKELKKSPLRGYNDLLVAYSDKFKRSERTFVRDWKQVQKRLQEWQRTINEALQNEEVERGVQEAKSDIISRVETLRLLADIARGEPYDTDGGRVYPTFSDQLRAIDTLARLEGWNAPTKQEVKGDFSVSEVKIVWEGSTE